MLQGSKSYLPICSYFSYAYCVPFFMSFITRTSKANTFLKILHKLIGILNLGILEEVKQPLFTIISNKRGRDRTLPQTSLFFCIADLVGKAVTTCFVGCHQEVTITRGRWEDWRDLLGLGDLHVVLSQSYSWEGEAYARKT